MSSSASAAMDVFVKYRDRFNLPADQVRACGKIVANLSLLHPEQKPYDRLKADLQAALDSGKPIADFSSYAGELWTSSMAAATERSTAEA